MDEPKLQRGKDGLFALCFRNSEKKSEKEIMEDANQYGECISFKEIHNGLVFIRFKEEEAAQRCLDSNPLMRIGLDRNPYSEKKGFFNPYSEKKVPKQPGKMNSWKSRKAETSAMKETHSESTNLQDENSVENAETASQKGPSIDISIGIQENRKKAVNANGPKQNVKTPKYGRKNGEVKGEVQACHGKLNSVEQPLTNVPDEMPPLINRAQGRPPKKLAVDMIFANFPDYTTQDDIEHLVETLHPLKVGGILRTKWNEPYCHVYVTEEAAILAERDYNLALYGGYHLVVARARTLLAEALKSP